MLRGFLLLGCVFATFCVFSYDNNKAKEDESRLLSYALRNSIDDYPIGNRYFKDLYQRFQDYECFEKLEHLADKIPVEDKECILSEKMIVHFESTLEFTKDKQRLLKTLRPYLEKAPAAPITELLKEWSVFSLSGKEKNTYRYFFFEIPSVVDSSSLTYSELAYKEMFNKSSLMKSCIQNLCDGGRAPSFSDVEWRLLIDYQMLLSMKKRADLDHDKPFLKKLKAAEETTRSLLIFNHHEKLLIEFACGELKPSLPIEEKVQNVLKNFL